VVGRIRVRQLAEAQSAEDERPRFYSVSATARLLGMSDMTLYRAIHAGQFPAVRVRGRLIVPAKAIDAMVQIAVLSGGLVDAASLVPGSESEAGS
jgi:excisionase family DNA binding protein